MEQKIFVGSANEKVFADGGKVLKISFNYNDLQNLLSNLNAKGYVNLNVNRSTRQDSKNSHYMSIDTWQPQQQQQAPQRVTHSPNKTFPPKEEVRFVSPDDDMPF